MNSRQTCVRGSVRALITVLLLAGIFTMHGLTGNHDAAMATHLMPASTAADQSAAVAPDPGHQESAVPAMAHLSRIETGPATPGAQSIAVPPRPTLTIEPGHNGHLHALGDVCLAMLAALLLAFILTLARHSVTVAHPIQLAGSAALVAVYGQSPPWRRPTLSKLCILRT